MELGIWGRQVDEMMEEAGIHHHNGHMLALQTMEAGILNWWRASPCPNAVMLALEYVRAALDNPVPGAHWTEPQPPQLVKVEDARKRWGSFDRERLAPSGHVPAFIPAGKTVRNWLGEPGEEVPR